MLQQNEAASSVEMTPGEDSAKDAAVEKASGSGNPWLWRLVWYGLFLFTLWVTIGLGTTEMTGVGAILMMLVLLFMRVPVGIALIVPSVLGMAKLYGWEGGATIMLGEAFYDESSSWTLSVVPMFIFMGMILWRAGMTTRLYDAMRVLFKRVPGSLAVGTNMAGGGLAAVSGSTMGVTYALARVGVPEMLRAGYDKRVATGAVLFSGLAGQLIPPSVLLVVFAGIASMPVGPTLVAGVVPGVLLVLMLALTFVIIGVIKPTLVGGRWRDREKTEDGPSGAEKLRVVAGCWPVPVLILVILGGIFSGILTETEAGAAGALVSVLLTFWAKRRKALRELWTATVETVTATASIFIMLIGAMMLTLVVGDSGAADSLAAWVTEAELSRYSFLGVLLVIYLIAGMFGESMVAMLLTVPILMPLLPELGVDPLFFAIFVVITVELGMVLPPTGVLVYVVHAITQEPEVNGGQKISLKDVFVGVSWILPVPILLIVVLTVFPELVTWLPNAM